MPGALSKPEGSGDEARSFLGLANFSKVDAALSFCNVFQFAAMLADKSAGANYQNYLYLAGGDKKRVVTMSANLSSASQIICFVGGPWIGNLSDFLGRKPVLVGFQLIMAVCWYLYDARAYATVAVAYPYVVAARHLKALCYGSFMATRMASLSDIYSGSRLAMSHSYLQASMGIGYIVGPLVLSPIIGRSVQRAFLFRVICCIGSAGVVAALLEETNVNRSGNEGANKDNLLKYETSKQNTTKRMRISNPLSFLTLFSGSRSLAYFSIAQAMQKMTSPIKSMWAVLNYQVHQILEFSAGTNSRSLMCEGIANMLGSTFTKSFLPLLGENLFVFICNAMVAAMFLMRSLANDKSPRSYFLYFASILPLVAGSQNAVVVDSYCMERGVKCGMGKGECSASLDNINVLIYVLAPQMWGYLYNRDHKLPLYVSACITVLSQIPFYLGRRAAKYEDSMQAAH